jgi:hypothetical protein
MAYLGSWVFGTLVIATRFLLDSCPFLLEMIGVKSSGSLSFQAHLRSTLERVSSLSGDGMHTPFEQLVERWTNWFQESALERLHEHSFFGIIFVYLLICIECTWNLMWGQLWVHGCLLVKWSFFLLFLEVFSIALCIRLALPHPLALGLSHCICGQPLDPMRIHLLSCAHGGERMAPHDVMWDAFAIDEKFHVLYE